MPTLKETIERSIKTYPMLYRRDHDVLNHLFLTNGTGYEWYKGELVIWTEMPQSLYRRRQQQPTNFDKDKEFITKYFPNREQRLWINSQIKTMRRTENHPFRHSYRSWYPVCCYAKIVNIPLNIAPDWLDGAVKTAWLVLMTDMKWDENTDVWDIPLEHDHAEFKHNVHVAYAVLNRYRGIAERLVEDANKTS